MFCLGVGGCGRSEGFGLCNGLALVVGGVGGSLVPGTVVAATGSFDRGLLSIAMGALLAGGATAWLAWRTKL